MRLVAFCKRLIYIIKGRYLMKKILSMVFIFLSIFPMSVTTFAEEQSSLKEIPSTIIVGELSALL